VTPQFVGSKGSKPDDPVHSVVQNYSSYAKESRIVVLALAIFMPG
jgi:hypothetical protein